MNCQVNTFAKKWSSKILTDLQKRRLIVMPRSGSLSFAEKDEMDDQVQSRDFMGKLRWATDAT